MSLPEPNLSHKRPRDELTEKLIQEALEDEQRRKREKKGLAPVGTGPGTIFALCARACCFAVLFRKRPLRCYALILPPRDPTPNPQ